MAVNLVNPPSTRNQSHFQNNTAPYYTFAGAANHYPNNNMNNNTNTTTDPNQLSRQISPLASGQATPVSSSSPSSPHTTSTSPSNWRNPCHSRQLRPPKAPLYVPAVLRPTEKPEQYSRQDSSSRASAITTSTTSIPALGGAGILTPPSTPSTSFDSNGSGMKVAEEGILRRMLGDDIARAGITRVVTDEWNDEFLEDVTGTPTRDHWKPDSLSPHCEKSQPPCHTPFTLFKRRHHCRRCGNIFCTSHSSHTVPLDQLARFHPKGTAGRACDSCWADFQAWRMARRARGSMSTESSGSVTPRGENASEEGEGGVDMKVKGMKKVQEVVGSVPRDWNWSTF